MAYKTLQNTASQADVQDADIFAVARGTGALSHVTGSAIVTYLLTALATSTGFLKRASNLSDLADAPTARTNLGLGTSATHAAGDFLTSAAPSATGGMTLAGGLVQSGATVQSVNALAALDIAWSTQDWHTKSISANSTFTFSGITAAKAQGIVLDLTISSSATTTWPATVKWSSGIAPTLGNGRHILGFLTDDGGSTVVGIVGAAAVA